MSIFSDSISSIMQHRTAGDIVLLVLISIVVYGMLSSALPALGTLAGVKIQSEYAMAVDAQAAHVQLAQADEKMGKAVEKLGVDMKSVREGLLTQWIFEGTVAMCKMPPGSDARQMKLRQITAQRTEYEDLMGRTYPALNCDDLE